MQRTRAWRRHQRNRIRNKRLRQIRAWWIRRYEDISEKFLGKMIDTPNPCTCWMCENPRKHGKLTLKEKISLQQYHDELQELLDDKG